MRACHGEEERKEGHRHCSTINKDPSSPQFVLISLSQKLFTFLCLPLIPPYSSSGCTEGRHGVCPKTTSPAISETRYILNPSFFDVKGNRPEIKVIYRQIGWTLGWGKRSVFPVNQQIPAITGRGNCRRSQLGVEHNSTTPP